MSLSEPSRVCTSTCLKKTDMVKFMVWDEISMMNKDAIKCVDRSMRDLRDCDQPFGRLTVLFSGDFRQILPVVPHGSLQDSVRACIKNSYLWEDVAQFHLTVNMRLGQHEEGTAAHGHSRDFANWLLQVGGGEVQTDPVELIELKYISIVPFDNNSPFDKTVVNQFYLGVAPLLRDKMWKDLATLFSQRVIITPLNKTVDKINQHLLSKQEGPTKQYKSVDAMEADWAEQVSVDILNSFNFAGFPQHDLHLKVGVVVVLLRNLHLRRGLCNGTRLLILAVSDNALSCLIITGPKRGTEIFLPRITLEHPGDQVIPIAFRRCQFLVTLAYAMTINKAQGQTVENVCLVLPSPVFAHGQLYVGLSRCTSAERTIVSLAGADAPRTINVVSKNAVGH